MRVLVTGATGFLGGHLIRRLLARGDAVIATGRDVARLAVLERMGARIVAHQFGDGAVCRADPVDAVVHAAALSSPWGRAAAFNRANIAGTREALDLARNCGARRFVHISSPSVYFRFADQINVGEDTDLPEPVNAYARTKAAAERLVIAAGDLDPVILRPRGLYGAGDTALLPRLVKAAARRPLPLMRDGRAVTDLTHVDDVVSAVSAALDLGSAPARRVFNVSGGEPLPVCRIAEAAALKCGIEVRWRAIPVDLALAGARLAETICGMLPDRPEPPVTAYGAGLFAYSQTLDLSAARDVLRWTPRIDFATGLDLTFPAGAP